MNYEPARDIFPPDAWTSVSRVAQLLRVICFLLYLISGSV